MHLLHSTRVLSIVAHVGVVVRMPVRRADHRHMSNCSLYELKNEILKFCLTNAVTQICTTNDKMKSPKILSPKD